MAARADTSTRRPGDVKFSELPSSIEQLPSLHLLDLSERVAQIAERILKHVKDPFPIEEASTKLEMVLHEEELIKASLGSTDPSSYRPISAACSYVSAPLTFLKNSQKKLVPNTIVSMPRNTHKFVETTLEKIFIQTIQHLGSGSFATVHLVKIKNEYFAIKKPSSQDEAIIALERESSHLMSFNPHPNIINVEAISYGKIFLEFASEGSLKTALESFDLTEELIQKYVLDIIEALIHIHKKGCTYKDLKPENVLISEGRAKLCDFGLATPTSTDKATSGTATHAAPEFTLDIFSQQADVWSLGVLMFNMITGEEEVYNSHPLETDSQYYNRIALITRNKPCNEEVIFRDVNKGLMEERDPKGIIRRLITQCLHGDPEQRITLDKVKETLEAARTPSNPTL
jgi:serine/threonine protein kinase